jgi:hypothetical protein
MMSGGSLTVSTPGSSVVINNGDVYAGGSIGITANGGGSFSDQNHTLSTSGSYTGQGTITYGSLVTSASSQLPPGVDFSSGSSGYANAANYSKMYDISVPAQLTQFETDITSGNGLVGPVTYVNGSISFGSWAKNKNLKINGLLVINGNLSTSSSNPLGNVSINDPGNHRSGILANGSITLANGTWSVNGVLYASGSLQLSTSNPFNINGGAVVAGGAITLSPGGQISISYSNTIPAAVFGPTAGPAYAAAIEHWEEEY